MVTSVLADDMTFVLGRVCCLRCGPAGEQPQGEPPHGPAQRRLNGQPVRQQRGRVHVSCLAPHSFSSRSSSGSQSCSCPSSERGSWLCWRPGGTRWGIRVNADLPAVGVSGSALKAVFFCVCRCSPTTRTMTPTRRFPSTDIIQSTSHLELEQVCEPFHLATRLFLAKQIQDFN